MTKDDDSEVGGEGKASAAAWSVDELRAWKATLIPFREAVDRIAQERGIGGEAATEWLRLAIRRDQVQPIVATFWASGFTLDHGKLAPEWGVPAIAFVENGDRVERVDGLAVDLRQALFDPDQIRAAARETPEPVTRKVARAVNKSSGRSTPLWKIEIILDAAHHLDNEGDLQQADIARFIMDEASKKGRPIGNTLAKEYAALIMRKHHFWRSRK